MDKKLPDNITIKGLRRLREAYKDFLGAEKGVCVSLELWNHHSGDIGEVIEVWWDDCGGELHFGSMKDAYERLEKMKKGEV